MVVGATTRLTETDPLHWSLMSRKGDLKRVDKIARDAGIPPERRRDFGRYIEKCKRSGPYDLASSGDATEEQLREMAKDFKHGAA